jgi:hypothetical protein
VVSVIRAVLFDWRGTLRRHYRAGLRRGNALQGNVRRVRRPSETARSRRFEDTLLALSRIQHRAPDNFARQKANFGLSSSSLNLGSI